MRLARFYIFALVLIQILNNNLGGLMNLNIIIPVICLALLVQSWHLNRLGESFSKEHEAIRSLYVNKNKCVTCHY